MLEEGGAGDSIIHGGFGMINFQGIVKPVYHGYRFLNLLGDEELARNEKGIVTRNSSTGKLSALVYHYDDEAVLTAVPNAITREQKHPLDIHLSLEELLQGPVLLWRHWTSIMALPF
ncbi:hypothetical protein E0698_24290 [Paenibacillus sp. 23TSA30-6]|nr:hypothetical protein [Paenibacillus sp. 23TSA30-6]